MATMRIQRIAELIKETLGDLMTKIKDPRIGFFTITRVEVSPDLDSAKVFISVLGNEEERDKTVQGLQSASGYLRHEMGKSIRLKKIPRLVFYFDPGIEKGVEMIRILEEVAANQKSYDEGEES
jgi:ribosome-binding factor A